MICICAFQLSSWNVVRVTEKQNFTFDFILFELDLKGLLWWVATILVSTGVHHGSFGPTLGQFLLEGFTLSLVHKSAGPHFPPAWRIPHLSLIILVLWVLSLCPATFPYLASARRKQVLYKIVIWSFFPTWVWTGEGWECLSETREWRKYPET